MSKNVPLLGGVHLLYNLRYIYIPDVHLLSGYFGLHIVANLLNTMTMVWLLWKQMG